MLSTLQMVFTGAVLGWFPQCLHSHTLCSNHLLTDLITQVTQSDLNVNTTLQQKQAACTEKETF